ncbi:hypothetical protein LCGC14_0876370 [marine sediment metagenome]|uniref:Uncharacterized protein n=1 Tax=marine sediment metagenome TaxID=412755 RepID=A0A0F9PNV8_9ZZZZ
MPETAYDEVWDTEGNLVSSVPRVVSDEDTKKSGAHNRLKATPGPTLAVLPWGPIIEDILTVLGYNK